MRYQLVQSSRSRTTEVWKGDDDSLVSVYYYKSGRVHLTPIQEIPPELTICHSEGAIWETDKVTEETILPAPA